MILIKKIYSPDEARALWDEDQLLYAAIAHSFPCCDLPQDIKCYFCQGALDGEWLCEKLAAARMTESKLKNKPRTWRGLRLCNLHTGLRYIVDCAFMSRVQLSPDPDHEPAGDRIVMDYRDVRKHFVEAE